MTALLVGLTVGLVLLLALHLIGAGFRNPRWLFVGALLIFALYGYGANQLAKDTADVMVTAQFSPECPQNYVVVTVHNDTVRAINSMRFDVIGFQPNHSLPVAKAYHSTDRIVAPVESWTHCWEVEQLEEVNVALHSSLRWQIEITGITLAD